MNAENITTDKPKIGGAVFRGPAGTTLPTDTTTALNSALKELGYISDAGISENTNLSTKETKAWGGDVVYSSQEGKSAQIKFAMLESTNPEVLKTVYGDTNVSGDLATGISVSANAKEMPECAWVIDMLIKGGAAKRITIPRGKVVAIGEVKHVDNDPVGYEVTVQCLPDTSGNTSYTYIKAASAGGTT